MSLETKDLSVRSLQTSADVRRFFRASDAPVYYVSTTTYNLLGLERWVGGLRFITTQDCHDGRHPGVFVPPGAPRAGLGRFADANNYLLSHPAVADHVRSRGPGGKALFLMFDERTEWLAARLGLKVCFPPAGLRHHLDSKLTTTRLANEIGVASVPHVLAAVRDYEDLRRLAGALGEELMLQLPHGDSGVGTFFISTAADFARQATAITGAAEVKVMRRIRCRPLTLEACVTRHGTLVGPLMTELIGVPALTPCAGGWCGNELTGTLRSDLRRRAQRAATKLGERLGRAGYRGCFGIDYLLDEDTDELYLGEMNPRITGITPLTTQAAFDADEVPLLLYHLLEWSGVDYQVDVDEFNARWLSPPPLDWSQLILYQTGSTIKVPTPAPASGVWRRNANGTVSFVRPACDLPALADENHARFIRTIDAGQLAEPGAGLGRLTLRGRVLEDGGLPPQAEAWVRGFRRQFEA